MSSEDSRVHAALGHAAGGGSQTLGLTPVGFPPHPAFSFSAFPFPCLHSQASASCSGIGGIAFFFLSCCKGGGWPSITSICNPPNSFLGAAQLVKKDEFGYFAKKNTDSLPATCSPFHHWICLTQLWSDSAVIGIHFAKANIDISDIPSPWATVTLQNKLWEGILPLKTKK